MRMTVKKPEQHLIQWQVMFSLSLPTRLIPVRVMDLDGVMKSLASQRQGLLAG